MDGGDFAATLFVYGVPLFLLLFCGLFVGGITERRHLASLERREEALARAGVRLSNLCLVPDAGRVSDAQLVMGQVVIATDYFKSFATALRNLVGGEMRAAQSLMTRGRREALVRLMEAAQRRGCNEVYNVRFDFSNISQMQGNRGAMQVEVHAWATAVRRAD